MDIVLKLTYIGFDLILPLVVGYLCRCQKRFDDGLFQKMINFNVWISLH
jgi:hypothetical protein